MLTNKLHNLLVNNNVSTKQAKQIKLKPMGDYDIKKYLPNTKIIINGDINKYNNIDKILPRNPDCAILLFRNSHNKGHWVLLSKYNNNIEYFDPYGYDISHPIHWIDEDKKRELNEYDHLTDLLNQSNYNVIVSKYAYQNRHNLDIATCGRWCILRALTILNKLLPLKDFQEILKTLKKRSKLSYDVIVSDLINYTN